MSDAKETEKGSKKLGLSRPGKLELNKTMDAGSVKQNFSHGRSKMVAVEKKRKRTYVTDTQGKMAELKDGLKGPKVAEVEATPEPAPAAPEPIAENSP